MPSIYLTINHYNKANNILPYKYLGSDQNDQSNYFGSSQKLQQDIKLLGKKNFEKQILYKFSSITNESLREFESQIQQHLDCAGSDEYYNKTNRAHKGFVETSEEKYLRMNKTFEARKNWHNLISNLSDQQRKQKLNSPIGIRNSMFNSSVLEKWIEKYGEQIAIEKYKIWKGNLSNNNGQTKYSKDQKNQVIDLFNKGFKRNEIVNITGVSYGIVKSLVKQC